MDEEAGDYGAEDWGWGVSYVGGEGVCVVSLCLDGRMDGVGNVPAKGREDRKTRVTIGPLCLFGTSSPRTIPNDNWPAAAVTESVWTSERIDLECSRKRTDSVQQIRSYQSIDILRSRADNTSNQTQHRSPHDHPFTTKDIRQATDEQEADCGAYCPDGGDPVEICRWADVRIDQCSDT